MNILVKIKNRITDNLYKAVHSDYFKVETGQTINEKNNLIKLLKRTNFVGGSIAEIGVMFGGSANIINLIRQKNKKLYLFDSFGGFDKEVIEKMIKIDPEWKTNSDIFNKSEKVKQSYHNVVNLFKDEKNVFVTKGWFPETLPPSFDNERFSFVHLDVDDYIPTKKSLEYIYPKINKDGILLFHDYLNTGCDAKLAIDEYLADKPEKIIKLNTSQAYIVKAS